MFFFKKLISAEGSKRHTNKTAVNVLQAIYTKKIDFSEIVVFKIEKIEFSQIKNFVN